MIWRNRILNIQEELGKMITEFSSIHMLGGELKYPGALYSMSEKIP
jgi:hypothetical protein